MPNEIRTSHSASRFQIPFALLSTFFVCVCVMCTSISESDAPLCVPPHSDTDTVVRCCLPSFPIPAQLDRLRRRPPPEAGCCKRRITKEERRTPIEALPGFCARGAGRGKMPTNDDDDDGETHLPATTTGGTNCSNSQRKIEAHSNGTLGRRRRRKPSR